MILSEVRDYLAGRKRVALMDMAYRFDADPEALRGMLAVLERKGRVRRLPPGTACSSSCNKCDEATVEIFEWVEPGARPVDPRCQPVPGFQIPVRDPG